MKKILWLGIIFSLLFVGHSFAAASFTVSTSGTTINATLSGVTNLSDQYKLLIQTTALPATPPTVSVIPGDISVQQPNAQGVVTWSIQNNTAGTTYYVGVEEIPQTIPPAVAASPIYPVVSKTVTTAQSTLFYSHLTTTASGSNVILQGAIDPVKQPNYQSYAVYLAYSASADMSNPINPNLQSVQAPVAGSPTGITDGSDGTGDPAGNYYWVLSGLNPNTTYYARQTIVFNGQSVVDAIVAFNGGTGAVVSNSAFNPITGTSTNLNSTSYTLLSGFPGLTVLPSPQVCAQEQAAATAAGTNPPLCNVNDLLNYALKLLIGISGVVLVFRLMYEGYTIMTTDVPFLKASSKAGFFSALLGLMLALSSYIILNTINPKLVSESVNVAQLNIGIAGGDTNAPTTFVSTGQMPTNVYCPGSGRSSAVSQIAQSYKGHVTYSQTNKTALAGPDGNAVLDCSSFANTVLKCAGYVPGVDFINEGSASIFGSAESVNMNSGFTINGSSVLINNKVLNAGDLVGWTPSQGGGNGHVIIYIGNATFADSHSSSTPGGAIGIYSAATIQSLYGGSRANDIIHEVKRTPL